jgi:hypothetical protein
LSLAFGQNWKITGGRSVPITLFKSVIIACYTVDDVKGLRSAGNSVLGYIVWLFALKAIPFILLCLWINKCNPIQITKRHTLTSISEGIMAFVAYGLVICTLSLCHLTHVSAMREASVIIAAWIGTVLIREPFGKNRILEFNFANKHFCL